MNEINENFNYTQSLEKERAKLEAMREKDPKGFEIYAKHRFDELKFERWKTINAKRLGLLYYDDLLWFAKLRKKLKDLVFKLEKPREIKTCFVLLALIDTLMEDGLVVTFDEYNEAVRLKREDGRLSFETINEQFGRFKLMGDIDKDPQEAEEYYNNKAINKFLKDYYDDNDIMFRDYINPFNK